MMEGGRADSCVVLGREPSADDLKALDVTTFDSVDLRTFYEEFNETQAPGVEKATLDGVEFYRRALSTSGRTRFRSSSWASFPGSEAQRLLPALIASYVMLTLIEKSR